MRIKTSELEGAALDFCVAKSLGKNVENRLLYVPSINWLFCGQYIERFRIALIPREGGLWGASVLRWLYLLAIRRWWLFAAWL